MRFQVLSSFVALMVSGISAASGQSSTCTFDHSKVQTPVDAEAFINLAEYANGQQSAATFNLEFLSNAPFATNGLVVLGWCVDYSRDIETGLYSMDLYSSYDDATLPGGAIDKTGNLKILTYLINTYSVDMAIPECGGTLIEFPDIQVAVWKIIDDESAPVVYDEINDIVYPHDECIVSYIVDDAKVMTDYEPDCENNDELLAVVMAADKSDGTIENQVIIAEVPLAMSGVCDCGGGGVFGDPHIKTWTGDRYDFHGVCDLVLVQNPSFRDNMGLDIHVRTEKTKQWSFIKSAVLRIGDETLEVVGGHKDGEVKYYLNKEAEKSLDNGLAGFKVSYNVLSSYQHEFVVDLKESGKIVFKTFKELVRVDVQAGVDKEFANSAGLMGQHGTGDLLDRSGVLVEDTVEFGMGWQVQPEEPMLFHDREGPQAPEQCIMPSTVTQRRRLGENVVTLEQAQVACSRVAEDDRDMCIFDVLAMDDKEVAGAY